MPGARFFVSGAMPGAIRTMVGPRAVTAGMAARLKALAVCRCFPNTFADS